jgi:hypothetical protein
VVVHHGLEDRRTPGNTLAVQPDKPYQGLSAFGTGFLSRFEGSQMPCPLLETISLIDTPGVLSGEKQRTGEWRGAGATGTPDSRSPKLQTPPFDNPGALNPTHKRSAPSLPNLTH